MTPEDAIRTKTWVTNDGRYLTVAEISDDHLLNIQLMLFTDMTPGYDLGEGRGWIAKCAKLRDYEIDGPLEGLDREAYTAAWLTILADEYATRHKTEAS